MWIVPLEPDSPHDITAARAHALPVLCRVAALGLCTAVHKGYTGAGIDIKALAQSADSDPDRHQMVQRADRLGSHRPVPDAQ